ncbi:hypothetical protein AB0N38_10695 [Micromonospora aurantiaca]|uniref:hypothetical protein n=1 Tax=Micromonospora aurantiaca (nom. illeg.) TaxID=47850 RepID=UPI0034174345
MSDSSPTTGAAGAAPDSPAGRDAGQSPSSAASESSPAVATTGPPGDTPTEPAAEVTHPSWCDRQACTAQPAPRLEDYQGGVDYGRHLSVTVSPGGHAMRLTQAVAPWATATILTVREDLPFVGVDLPTLGAYLAELGAVPGGPLTDAELADGRDRADWVQLAAGVWTADPAGRYLARRVAELITGENVDPLRLVADLRRSFATYTALTEGRRR